MDVRNLIKNIAFNNYEPNLDELEQIISVNGDDMHYLFSVADKVREEYCSNEVQIRAIIEFSNYCRCHCKYCGLNCHNTEAKRYRMSPEEIVSTAKEAVDAGYKTLVLQSGEDMFYTKDMVCNIVKDIKAIDDIAITLSIGERSYDEFKAFKEAGADRFLIKHETADEDLYNSLHPHSTFKRRIQCLKDLKSLGFQTGSGFMIGLPNQTNRIIAKDIMLLKEMGVHMAGIGPFISHPKTDLKNCNNGDAMMTLKAVATTRILLKDPMLPVTTSLGVLEEKNKSLAFGSGANVIMQKVQPIQYRKMYEIYPKDTKDEPSVLAKRLELEDFIKSCGRKISKSKGDFGLLK